MIPTTGTPMNKGLIMPTVTSSLIVKKRQDSTATLKGRVQTHLSPVGKTTALSFIHLNGGSRGSITGGSHKTKPQKSFTRLNLCCNSAHHHPCEMNASLHSWYDFIIQSVIIMSSSHSCEIFSVSIMGCALVWHPLGP